VSPLLDSDPMVERKSKKREISAVTTLTSIPKKLRSPEIASVDEEFVDVSEKVSTRRKVLLTDQR